MTATGIRTPVAVAVAERPAHRDGNVLRWLAAYTASMMGDGIYFVALSWAAARSGSPGQAGLVLALGAVPRAALMLGGGVVADRFGPRRVVIGSDAVRCAVILGVAALLFVSTPGIWLLGAVALVFGAVDALFVPSVGALPPRLTSPGQLGRVQGMRGLGQRVALVVGAPLGGLTVAVGGSSAAFAVAGVLFAVSLPLLFAVRLRELPPDDRAGPDGGTARRQLADGLRYMRGHKILAPLLVTAGVAELGFTGPANIGLVLLVDERGWSAAGMGWIIAGFGVGAGSASLLIAVRGRIPRAGTVQSYGFMAGAASLASIGFAPSVALAALGSLGVGLCTGLSGALCAALLQTHCDPAYLGRVTSVTMLIAVGLAPLTYPVTGAAIGAWGIGPVFVASAALSAAGGVYALCSRALRRAELPCQDA
ncbi:MFS transporter [Streptomyces sp. NPDC059009]|uniref:MFS transporter n=1 Tax=Streptomyces sp. NPDC059009 TaxID=3346694 RepID=UPI0036AC91AF